MAAPRAFCARNTETFPLPPSATATGLAGNNMPFPFLTPVMEEIVDKAPDSFKNNPMIKDYITAARSNMEKIRAMN